MWCQLVVQPVAAQERNRNDLTAGRALVVQYREMLTGYLEEREALRWVQKHISAFGGDPSKVTM